MKTYTNYTVTKCIGYSGVFYAFKQHAATIPGSKISFSHHFYFRYANIGNCSVNGRNAEEFTPSLNDNYFIACAENGVVLSRDMAAFFYQNNRIDHINYKPISVDEIKKLNFEYKDEN